MINRAFIFSIFIFSIIAMPLSLVAQDKRAQYPHFIAGKIYTEVTAGYVSFPFSDKDLLPGFTTEKIDHPHVGVRLGLLGYQFNSYFSAQISYMRPVFWVYFKNVNDDHVKHTVSVTITSLVLRGRVPVSKNVSVYGEAGFALLTRSGFYVGAPHVLRDANYGTVTLGGGLQYHLNTKWSLMGAMTLVPKKDKEHQPYSLAVTAGFHYLIHPLPEQKVAAVRKSPYVFPRQLLQVGYTTNAFGFGVNNFFANNVLPVFWAGNVEIKRGVSVHYQRNFFHTRKGFSIDWGASASYWKTSGKGQDFYTASIYPLFRFTFLRKKSTDVYFNYSVAGPSFISQTNMDNIETGEKFTFQDFMGAGIYTGKKRNLNAEIRIMHFSNGGLFVKNNGVKVPLSFMVGYAF